MNPSDSASLHKMRERTVQGILVEEIYADWDLKFVMQSSNHPTGKTSRR